ncbi:MAG: hypothetical protein QM744_10885 [Mesorhizobium sp.]
MSWSITEMSKLAKASDPSVIRLCRRMGCNGFPSLKLELAQALAAVQKTPRQQDAGRGRRSGRPDHERHIGTQ